MGSRKLRGHVFGCLIVCCSALSSRGVAANPYLSQNETWSLCAAAVLTRGAYACDASGVQDTTPVLQQAINDVARARGGVVYLPKGRYRVNGPLRLGTGVALVGEKNEDGTPAALLLAYAQKGQTEGALLTGVGPETSIEGLGFYYPEQSADQITPYPWTLAGTLVKIKDVVLYNSYQGLKADSSLGVNGAVIENLRGTVLSRGIEAPFSSEFSWIHDVDFSADYWAQAPEAKLSDGQKQKVKAYLAGNLIALEVGRIDGMALERFHADGAKLPVLLRSNPKFRPDLYGFGAVVSGFPTRRQEEGTDPWYYGMHYANLDNVPEAQGQSYTFAPEPLPRRTDAASFYNVKSTPFGAKGDGVADDSAALQAALRAAGENGGGTVFLPNGDYKITTPLVVPPGVELRGSFGAGRTRDDHSCRIALYSGRGSAHPETDEAGITLQESAGLRGLDIVHPDQHFDATSQELIPYPFAIRGAGNNVWIVDVGLVDSYNGIDLGKNRCDNFLVRGVWGTAFSHGLVVSGASSGGHLERLAFTFALALTQLESNTPNDQIFTCPTATFYQDHATAYSFGNCSHLQAWGLVSFNSWLGVRFFADQGGAPDSVDLWQSLFDASTIGSIDAEAGSNIRCLGFFSTYNPYDRGKQPTNWLEVTPAFTGPLAIYAKTLIQPSLSHPYDFTDQQVVFHDEVSLTTASSATPLVTSPSEAAAQVLDRNPRTYWDMPAGAYFQVDLGTVRKIDRFAMELCPFSADSLDNGITMELDYSLDGQSFNKAATLKVRNSFDQPLSAPIDCRYVRLDASSRKSAFLPLSRFDVFNPVSPDFQP